MLVTYDNLRENSINGWIIADLYYDNSIQCGVEFRFNYDLDMYELVDTFAIESAYIDLNDDERFQELNCNRTFIERAFNALNIGG